MNGEFNWRRVVAFAPVMVGLALLTAYGPDLMPRYLVGLIVIGLFFVLFLIYMSSSRWKSKLRPITTCALIFLLSAVSLGFVASTWIERTAPQALPWLTFALIMLLLSMGFIFIRRKAEK